MTPGRAAVGRYRRDIDGLRAIAVVPVVLFHAGAAWFSGGFVGVDVFFVISGYLITGIIRKEIREGRFSVVSFYERRARRILPALFLVLAVTAAICWVILPPRQFSDFGEDVAAAVLFAANIRYLVSVDYFAGAPEYSMLLHTWSLAVEEQFYLFWPLILVAVSRSGRRLLPVTAALFLASFAGSAVTTFFYPAGNFYLLPARAWELLAGGILASGVVPPLRGRWPREAAAAAGVGLIAAAVLLYDAGTPFPGLAAALPCLGACLVIHSGGETATGRAMSCGPMLLIGLVSYSFYLWHWPLLSVARILNAGVDLPAGTAVAVVAASFLLAVLSWRFVEQPFRRPGALRRPAVFALSGGAALVALLGALAVELTDGLPARFSGSVAAVALGTADVDREGRGCDRRLPSAGLCRIGAAGGDPTVLLWGDSHAGALRPAIDEVLKSAGRSAVIATHAACPPILGVASDKKRARSCVRFNEAIAGLVEAPGSTIDTVVLAARWALARTGTRAPGEPGAPVTMVALNGSPGGNRELFDRYLDETVARLRRAGVRVVLLGNVPEIGWNVPLSATARLRLHLAVPEGPPAAAVEARAGAADAVLSALAQRPGVSFIRLAPMLCRARCMVMQDGRPLYSDEDHLSVHGARFLAPMIAARLLPVLDGAVGESALSR